MFLKWPISWLGRLRYDFKNITFFFFCGTAKKTDWQLWTTSLFIIVLNTWNSPRGENSAESGMVSSSRQAASADGFTATHCSLKKNKQAFPANSTPRYEGNACASPKAESLRLSSCIGASHKPKSRARTSRRQGRTPSRRGWVDTARLRSPRWLWRWCKPGWLRHWRPSTGRCWRRHRACAALYFSGFRIYDETKHSITSNKMASWTSYAVRFQIVNSTQKNLLL